MSNVPKPTYKDEVEVIKEFRDRTFDSSWYSYENAYIVYFFNGKCIMDVI